jgi:hypothetical protein
MKLHHTAMIRMYVSRKNPDGVKRPYKGKFGEGYIVMRPNWESTRYSFIDYYINEVSK